MAVTDAIQKVCRSYECNACEGILSYQLKRNNYNTEKTIILNPNEQQKYVYLYDILQYNIQTYYQGSLFMYTCTGIVVYLSKKRLRSICALLLCVYIVHVSICIYVYLLNNVYTYILYMYIMKGIVSGPDPHKAWRCVYLCIRCIEIHFKQYLCACLRQ